MGKLSDITAQAVNTPKNHLHSLQDHRTSQSPAGMGKENLGKSRSPHFMTPTFSSSKQTATPNHQVKGPTSTPEPARPVKVDGMMKSAARRVGFRRAGDGTPRSRKEGLAKQAKAINFPDKFATPLGNVSDSSPSSQGQASQISPKDKPLPSPPIAQLHSSTSSTLSSHSLIDASDKPLRRSPTGQAGYEEEWPVLQPRRPSSPGTLQEMMRDTGTQLTQQIVSSQQERYPILGNTTLRQVPDDDQLPLSRYSAQHKIPRREVSSPKVQKQNDEEKGSGVKVEPIEKREPSIKKSIDDPFRDGIYNTDLSIPSDYKVTSPPNPSVPKSSIKPRQNRTSFLRARLSAGQADGNGRSKANGQNTFAASDESVDRAGQKENVRARTEAAARRSTTPPVSQPLRTRASRDSLAGNRAPAKFVAGSRRPSNTHRPSSRGSFRDEARASSPPRPGLPAPSRAAPSKPDTQDVKTNVRKNQTEQNGNQRTSSIPISRKTTPDVITRKDRSIPQNDLGTAKSTAAGNFSPKKEARSESNIYDNHSSRDFLNDLEGTPPPRSTVPRLAPFLIDNKDAHVLEAIEESPQHAYQTKRLSVTSSDYGPTLKISPSAERFIMGSSPRPGSRPHSRKSSKEFERARPKGGLISRKSGTPSTLSSEKLPERPSSSQGLSRVGTRISPVDPAIREKKVKSADVSLISPKIANHVGETKTQQPHDISNNSDSVRGSGTSSGTAPYFFDAPEEIMPGNGRVAPLDAAEDSKRSASPSEVMWIAPLKTNDRKEAPSNEHSSLGLQSQAPDPSEEMWIAPLRINASEEAPSSNEHSSLGLQCQAPDRHGSRTEHTNPFHDNNTEAQDWAKQQKGEEKKSMFDNLPTTPRPTYDKRSGEPGIHPPRSSSRMSPPDWTGNKKSPSPPITAEKIPPPTPPKPKNFAHRQNNLGSLRGHGSSQLDLKNPQSKHNSLQDSNPRDSLKSQASLPRGNSVLSNLRGLFHKRSTETEPQKSATKSKPKVTVTRNGSPYGPYPPISEIHPIHRPTLASSNRSKASTPIQRGPLMNHSFTTPATPSYASPLPTDVSTTTAMAMQILEAARTEASSPKKERLMRLGEVMVEAITQARDAEKAMEEAKQAARKAEVAHVLCQKSLGDVNRCVQEWRGSQVLDGRL